jgi:hypothetical protein
MTVYQYGTLNTASLVVPGLYEQIVPPAIAAINGAGTDVLGLVGAASWGPVNTPVRLAPSQYVNAFGPVLARKFDIGTHVAVAAQQVATDIIVVRFTDGTDTAATSTLTAAELAKATAFYAALALAINAGVGVSRGKSNLVTFNATTGMFVAASTGSYGNTLSVLVAAGSKVGTYKSIISLNGGLAEVFDNIAAPAVPTAQTLAFAGGTDGYTGITADTLVGVDMTPRTGMYALRNQACSVGVLCDCDDPSTWTVQGAFGLSECVYMVVTGPSGDTPANAVASKASAGLDNYAVKVMFGDYVYWNDNANQLLRLVSPQAFAAGELVSLTPNNSALNKALTGIVATQRSGSGLGTYSQAELSELISAGIDVIANPSPGGTYWSCQSGHNSSSDSTRYGDNYTRMTFFLAESINNGMGIYIGQVISMTLLQNVASSLLDLLQNIYGQGLIGSPGNAALPFSVLCNLSNNPQARTGIGYVQADVAVQLQGINEKFLINLQDGATVTIASASTQS